MKIFMFRYRMIESDGELTVAAQNKASACQLAEDYLCNMYDHLFVKLELLREREADGIVHDSNV